MFSLAFDSPVARVEAYTGKRPVMVFGALADQVVASLLEKSPHTFYPCPTVKVKDVSPNTEARLKLDLIEGKIIDFWKTEAGYEIIKVESFIKGSKVTKGTHVLRLFLFYSVRFQIF